LVSKDVEIEPQQVLVPLFYRLDSKHLMVIGRCNLHARGIFFAKKDYRVSLLLKEILENISDVDVHIL
jgi:hypothetical protein